MIETLSTLFPRKREEAWRRLLELGFPEKKDEAFRYVPLSSLYRMQFATPDITSPQFETVPNRLLFFNGRYCPEFSSPPEGVQALSLSRAFLEYKSFLTHRYQQHLADERNPFTLVNTALFAEGLFLYIPPHTTCEVPICVHHIVDSTCGILLPRISVFVGKGASVQLYTTQATTGEKFWINGHFDFSLEEKGALQFVSVADENPSSWHFESIRATLRRDSCFNSYAATTGGNVSRHDYFVSFLGEGGNVSLNGLWKLDGSKQHHVNAFVDHKKEACTSLQKFKGILSDHSRSSFEGKIYVHSQAQKTNAYQMNHNLLVGKHAVVHSKPNLEIFADDVKASHGATAGRLDEEALFYFKTRGIPDARAKTLLIDGFAKEILDAIPIKNAQQEARKLFSQ